MDLGPHSEELRVISEPDRAISLRGLWKNKSYAPSASAATLQKQWQILFRDLGPGRPCVNRHPAALVCMLDVFVYTRSRCLLEEHVNALFQNAPRNTRRVCFFLTK